MEQKKHKIEILTILFKNLNNPKPDLLPTSAIESQMDISAKDLRKTLNNMKGMGLIQTDPDYHFNLITREGISWLSMQNK